MTSQKSFKRLVRTRMEKTGESYTAARAVLLTAREPSGAGGRPPLATSDEAIRLRTGRGWEEWFDLLDEWGAGELGHREIARRVAEEQEIEPLAWDAQAVTTSYQRARGGRAVGQHPGGFEITASKTVGVPVDRLYDAWVDESLRSRWLPDDGLRARTALRARSARFDWADGATRVNVFFSAKGDARSTVTVQHERLADAAEAERMKAFWRERVAAFKDALEG